MVEHDSPISLSPSGGSIARAIVAEKNSEHWNLPEGTILYDLSASLAPPNRGPSASRRRPS